MLLCFWNSRCHNLSNKKLKQINTETFTSRNFIGNFILIIYDNEKTENLVHLSIRITIIVTEVVSEDHHLDVMIVNFFI